MTRALTAMTTAPTDPLSEVSPSRRLARIGSNCSHPHVATRCIAAVSRAASGALMLLALSHGQAYGGEVSCSESPLVFDLHVPPDDVTMHCRRGSVGTGAFERLALPNPWELRRLMAVSNAFFPEGSDVSYAVLSSNDGRHARVYLNVAHDGTRLGKPNIRRAIEAAADAANPGQQSSIVVWETTSAVGEYSVESYRRVTETPEGLRDDEACFAFMRHLDGSEASHARRVVGTYCEAGTAPITAPTIRHVLGSIAYRPDLAN